MQEHGQTAVDNVFTPAEAGKALGCSGATVRRLAVELRFDVLRTAGGSRLFTAEQVEKMRTERTRRASEGGGFRR